MIAMNLLIILSIIYMVRLHKIGMKQRDNDLSGDINIATLEAADKAAFYIYYQVQIKTWQRSPGSTIVMTVSYNNRFYHCP